MLAASTETARVTSKQAHIRDGALEALSAPVLLVALFSMFSRVQDYVSYLHLPLILLTTCLLAAVFSGGLYRALAESRIGNYLSVLTALFAVSVVFSVWMGGSFQVFTNTWLKSYAIHIIVAALLTTIGKMVRAIWACVLGIFITAATALFLGTTAGGRLSTSLWQGSYADPNDLAQVLILGICLGCAILSRKQTGWVGRASVLLMLCFMFLAGAKTGSRGGLIGVVMVVAVLFFQSSVSGKVRILLVCAVAAVLAAALLSDRIMNRYLAALGNDSAQEQLSSGEIGSVQGREYLFIQSLYITARHPLTGVGLGMFMVAEDTIAKSTGVLHGSWHETHNMYTQVSSEAGLPALFCFIAAFVYGFKNLNYVCRAAKHSRDPAVQDAGALAFWMRLALVGLASTGFFLSVAYTAEPVVLLAMTVGLERAVRMKIATAPAPTDIPAFAGVASVPARTVHIPSRPAAKRPRQKPQHSGFRLPDTFPPRAR
jgi:O-antigen ligase